MNFFWPNFDLDEEQIRNTKRENGQTDAGNPYKQRRRREDRGEL